MFNWIVRCRKWQNDESFQMGTEHLETKHYFLSNTILITKENSIVSHRKEQFSYEKGLQYLDSHNVTLSSTPNNIKHVCSTAVGIVSHSVGLFQWPSAIIRFQQKIKNSFQFGLD